MTTYEIQNLQAVEPDALPRDQGVNVFVHDELDGMGFPEVTLSGPTPEALVDYVATNWGTEDLDWLAEVSRRVVEIDAPAVGPAGPLRAALLAVDRGLFLSECDTRWIDGQEDALEFVHDGERYRLTVERVG